MAFSDYAVFLPAESLYVRPGAYEDALKAEAVKQAAYLGELSRFYKTLTEQKREFDLRHLLEKERLALQKAEQESLSKYRQRELDIAAARQKAQASYWRGLVSVQRGQQEAQEDYWEGLLGLQNRELDLRRYEAAQAAEAAKYNYGFISDHLRQQQEMFSSLAQSLAELPDYSLYEDTGDLYSEGMSDWDYLVGYADWGYNPD